MNELYHYGILGMHWGVRRYQNKDGTLTKAGKRREAKLRAEERNAELKRVRAERADANKYRSILSDEELRERIDRLKLENELDEKTKAYMKSGENATAQAFKKKLADIGINAASGTMVVAGRAALVGSNLKNTDYMNEFRKDAAKIIFPNPNEKKKK